ncbi:hypothetical protein BRD02_10900 [Halobacteriales archaeon QS_8_69_73]|nr:MAG: hypothetical protein BRD02_10900 [Halobacteriales archaeon QS_8_69_73]
MTDNRVTDSGSGVWLIGSSGSTVARNTVRENGYLGVLAISDVEDFRSETRRLERRLGESELPSATTAAGRSLDGPRRSDRRDAPVRPPERTDADRPGRLEQLDERRTERDERRTERNAASTSRGVKLAANATDRALSKEVNASLSNRWSTLALPDNRTVRRTPEAAGVTASDNVIRGNALSNNGAFFGGNALLFGGVNETIADNTIAGGSTGLVVAGGGTPTVRGNRVTDTGQGVLLLDTDRALLRDNVMANNAYNFDVTGSYDHDIDESNTVNGDPVLYRNGVEDFVLEGPTDYGYIGIVNAENVTVRNVTVSNQGNGIHLSNVDGGLVDDVTLTDNFEGIRMQAVDDVTVKRVTARNNIVGVLTRDASGVFVGANRLDDNLIGVVSLELNNPAQSTGTPLPGTTVADNDISGNAIGTLHFGGSDVPRTDRVVGNDIDGGFIGVFNLGSSIEVADNRLSGSGIVLAGIDEESGPATVSDNTVRDTGFGLISISSDGSVDIESNCFVDSNLGLSLARSQNHVLRNNEMRDNQVGMEVVSGYDHDIDRSNTVNGKPVYYLRDETGTTIGADVDPGYLAVVDSTDVTIRDLTLTGIGGLPVAGSTDVTVADVTVRNSSGGLRLVTSTPAAPARRVRRRPPRAPATRSATTRFAGSTPASRSTTAPTTPWRTTPSSTTTTVSACPARRRRSAGTTSSATSTVSTCSGRARQRSGITRCVIIRSASTSRAGTTTTSTGRTRWTGSRCTTCAGRRARPSTPTPTPDTWRSSTAPASRSGTLPSPASVASPSSEAPTSPSPM